MFGQRWNPPGQPAIYMGTSFAVCLIEVLVHANRKTPPSAARHVEAVVPDDVSREVFDPAAHADWDDLRDTAMAQAFGRAWIEERRSALLFVPSVVTAGRDTNVVVNPDHPYASHRGRAGDGRRSRPAALRSMKHSPSTGGVLPGARC